MVASKDVGQNGVGFDVIFKRLQIICILDRVMTNKSDLLGKT